METIAVIFGGRSVEHEVSVVTGLQVIENLDSRRYRAVPIYIAKTGVWYSGDELTKIDSFKQEKLQQTLIHAHIVSWDPMPGNVIRLRRQTSEKEVQRSWFHASKPASSSTELAIDAVIPALHGTFGEDGSLQGFLEMTGVPYTSSGLVGSAVGMDKIVMKSVFRGCGIPVVDYEWFTREAWDASSDEILGRITDHLEFPMFVKPCNLGSSVGISRVETMDQLRTAVEIAKQYDTRILVEQGISDVIEINVSVLGDELSAETSLCERPISWESFLTYDDKYVRGNFNKSSGTAREIPAQLPDEVTKKIQSLAVQTFHAVAARGVVRVDFLVTQHHVVYVNEINTIPGSFAFYLWEPTGLKYQELLTKLIELAKKASLRRKTNITSFDSGLLEKFHGQKGSKS